MEIEMEQQMSSATKKAGEEYYELKFQLRLHYFDNIEDEKKKFFDIVINQFEGINRFEEKDNGFDFFFREITQLSKISRYFQKYYYCEEKRSKKIVTRDSLRSKDVWRHTLLITILNFSSGDLVRIKGEEYYIKSFNKKDLVLRHAKTGAKKTFKYSIIKEYFELLEKSVSTRN